MGHPVQYLILDSETIEELYLKTKQLSDRVTSAQSNVRQLVSDIETWSLLPLFERKDGKKDNLLGIDDRTERAERRYEQIKQTSVAAAAILKENYRLFFNLPEPPEPPPVMNRN